MKTDMKNTSLNAYESIKPDLGKKQQDVLEVIENHPNLCNYEIAEKLGWPINRVTPRCKELREFGFVVDNGKKTCPSTNRESHMWVITENE